MIMYRPRSYTNGAVFNSYILDFAKELSKHRKSANESCRDRGICEIDAQDRGMQSSYSGNTYADPESFGKTD